MRSVLALAVTLLALAVGLRLSQRFAPEAAEVRGPSNALTLLATSRGLLLPSAPLTGGDEQVSDLIAVGDLLLKESSFGRGLRVALLAPDLSLVSFRNLDLASSPEQVSALNEIAADADEGSVLVLAVQGAVRHPGGDSSDLDDAVTTLGARVSPFRAPRSSWALIATRESSGWRALSEAYSETQSVSLSTTLSVRPGERTRSRAAELLFDVASGTQRLDLSDPNSAPSFESARVAFNRWASVGSVIQPAFRIRVEAALAEGASGPDFGLEVTRWDDLALGLAPRFESSLSVAGDSPQAFLGAECQLRIDGEVVATTRVARPEAWQPFDVDLSAYSGRTVRLELCTLPLAGDGSDVPEAEGGSLYWARPVLIWEAAP